MVTLQKRFEKDFPDKDVREIDNSVYNEGTEGKYKKINFTNYDLDLREYVNLESLFLEGNNLTSADFLNTLPNPKKLRILYIYNNKIQPTDIAIFSRFVNLKKLKIGTMSDEGKQRNLFYGSLKSYQNLTKLETICIEATDVNEGLEYLPTSLARSAAEQAKKQKK